MGVLLPRVGRPARGKGGIRSERLCWARPLGVGDGGAGAPIGPARRRLVGAVTCGMGAGSDSVPRGAGALSPEVPGALPAQLEVEPAEAARGELGLAPERRSGRTK